MTCAAVFMTCGERCLEWSEFPGNVHLFTCIGTVGTVLQFLLTGYHAVSKQLEIVPCLKEGIVDLHGREAVSRVIQCNVCVSQHSTLSRVR